MQTAPSPQIARATKTNASRANLLGISSAKLYLHQRWNQGTTCAARLVEELRAQGYPGSAAVVGTCLRPFREQSGTPHLRPRHPRSAR